jgi:recombination protein U
MSSVDFIGVYNNLAVAFDAKVTNLASLRVENVKPHQLDMLQAFTACTGVGFLLVCFERPDLAKTFICTATWFTRMIAKSRRRSVPFDAFEHAASHAGTECCEVFHGEQGVPVNFGPAAWKLRLAINAAT